MSTRKRLASCPGERLLARCKARLMLVSLALASLVIATGCGSSARATPKQTPTSTPSATPTASPTPDASDAAVLAAYQAYFAAVDQANAATSSPGAWNLPALSATMVNPLLQQWQSEFIQFDAQGIIVQGTLTPQHPRVTSNTGTTAVVSDCLWDVAFEYYRSTNGGTPDAVPSQPDWPSGGGDGERITFTLVSGKWMASSVASLEYGNCTGY